MGETPVSPEDAAAVVANVMSRHVHSAGVVDGTTNQVDLQIRDADGEIHRFLVTVTEGELPRTA